MYTRGFFRVHQKLTVLSFLYIFFIYIPPSYSTPYDKTELQKLREFSAQLSLGELSKELKEIDAILQNSDDAKPSSDLTRAYSLLEALVLSSAPQTIQRYKTLTGDSIALAEEAFAESLSSEYWSLAKDNQAEAEVIGNGILARSSEIASEKDISTRVALFRMIESELRQYIQKQEFCLDYAKNAVSLSLAQAPALLDSQSDIFETIHFFKKIRNPEKLDSVEMSILEKEIEESIEMIRTGSIRNGFYRLEGIRRKLDELVMGDFKAYAATRISLGRTKWEEASSFLELERKRFSDDPDTLLQLEDNLRAAKESIELAEKLLQSEKYIESISKAEDSLFLTERFKEDLELADLPDTKLYDDGVDTGVKIPPTHTVKRGETLIKISTLYFKTYKKWREIYKLNRKTIKNPSKIYPFQILKLP